MTFPELSQFSKVFPFEKKFLRGDRFARAEHMQKLNRSMFFFPRRRFSPHLFQEKGEKTTAATKRGRGRRGVFKKRGPLLSTRGGRRKGIRGRRGNPPLKIKPFVVKYEFQNSLMYVLCSPPPKPKIFARPRMVEGNGDVRGSLPIRPFSVRYLRFFFSLRTFYPATLQCPKKAFFLPAKELFCCLLLCPGRERKEERGGGKRYRGPLPDWEGKS